MVWNNPRGFKLVVGSNAGVWNPTLFCFFPSFFTTTDPCLGPLLIMMMSAFSFSFCSRSLFLSFLGMQCNHKVPSGWSIVMSAFRILG